MALSKQKWLYELGAKILSDGSVSKLHRVVVHTFSLGDVEDPDLYAAEPMIKWRETDAGKWVIENAIDVYWLKELDPMTYGYKFAIVAQLIEKDYIMWSLKYK